MFDVKHSSDLQLLETFFSSMYFLFLDSFHIQSAAFIGGYHVTLASITSLDLQNNPGFNFTSSHNENSMQGQPGHKSVFSGFL